MNRRVFKSKLRKSYRTEYYRYHDVVLAGLSTRAACIVHNNCFPKTKDQIRQDVESGTLDLMKLRNCGKKTVTEIFNWLGLIYHGQKWVTCPCCQTRLVYSKGEVFQLKQT